MVHFLFCADPLDPTQPDPAYAHELAMIQQLNAPYGLVHLEALLYHQDVAAALADLPPLRHETLTVYRGWSLKPETYNLLYNGLWERGWVLVNRPDHYRHAHYLPNHYALLREYTPRSAWMETGPEVPIGDVMALMELFDKRPVIIRDYAHTHAQHWDSACYLPSAADESNVAKSVRHFMELAEDDLSGGLVVREYVALEPLGLLHQPTARPLYKEFRSFWVDGQLVSAAPSGQGEHYQGVAGPKWEQFRRFAEQFPARFLSLDVAKKLNSEWIIIEADDGQVTPLPPSSDLEAFYRKLTRLIKKGAPA